MALWALVFPISIAIAVLLVIVTISYEQTIHAYPGGGGAYIVARDNLGELPAQTAGAALLTDYILTVAVSISSGVAQIASAFPALSPYRVEIAVVLVLLRHAHQPARRARVGHGVRHPDLLLHRHDVPDGGSGLLPLLRRDAGRRQRPAAGYDRDGRPVGRNALPAAARLFQRHGRPDRRRGHLQWHHGLQGAAQPQRRHHADLDVGASWVRSSSASRFLARADRRRTVGGGDGDLATGAHRLRRAAASSTCAPSRRRP